MATADLPPRTDRQQRLVTAVIVGCGNRGQNYAGYAVDHPEKLRIVGAADPLRHRLQKLKDEHGIPEDRLFADWRDLAEADRMADFAVVSTQDRMHRDPAVALAAKGYSLLIEKPLAVSEEDCLDVARAAADADGIYSVCHVLRYFPPCRTIRRIIEDGTVGRVMHVDHRENVGFYHFAHSFVRGNWRNSEESTFALMAKCCHDLDLIAYWMDGNPESASSGKVERSSSSRNNPCVRVQSFGSLGHFRRDQAPPGAGVRCHDCGVEAACPYSALSIYRLRDLSPGVNAGPRWPMSVVCDVEDDPRGYRAALEDAVRTGPYGRCVYACDNDVVDHQAVNMEFRDGATASFTMTAFSGSIKRETVVSGTLGEIRWDSDKPSLELLDFASGTVTDVLQAQRDAAPETFGRLGGHMGADFFLMDAFVRAVATGDRSLIGDTSLSDCVRSHQLVFAAEKSRLSGGTTIDLFPSLKDM